MQKAKEAWEKAKRDSAEKLVIRTHRAQLHLAIELSMAVTGAGAIAAARAAATTAAALGALGGWVGVGVGYLTALNAMNEADAAWENALVLEGEAFGNYLVAKRRWCTCRRANRP